jgi:opacity protein-like surface antigen
MHTRKILLFTVLLLMTPALASGSTARLEGFGVPPAFVEDYANMFTFPVSITRYPSVVVGELGNYWGSITMDRAFGATMGLGEDMQYGVFGIMLRENSAFSPYPAWEGEFGSQFDVLWGMNFGTGTLGIRFDRANSELEYTDAFIISPLSIYDFGGPYTVNDFNTMGFAVSAAFEVGDESSIEGTVEYRTLDFSIEDLSMAPDEWMVSDKGEPSYSFMARGFFAMDDVKTVVPMIGYMKYDGSWEIESTDPTDEDSADETITGMHAGIGMKVDVGSFFMVGVGYSQWKMEGDMSWAVDPGPATMDNYEFTSTAAPFFFGCLETPMTDWLTVRFGATKNLVGEEIIEETFDGTKTEIKSSNGNIPSALRGMYPYFAEQFTFAMGVTVTFGDLVLDATLHELYPFTGMYWLSGIDEVPFGRISATYHY